MNKYNDSGFGVLQTEVQYIQHLNLILSINHLRETLNSAISTI
jgi:hypothetical protein